MPVRIDPIIAMAALVVFSVPTHAQTPVWPTAEDVARAQRETPFPSAEQLRSQAIPRPPLIEGARPGLDIEALARAGAGVRQTATAPRREIPVRIFVTLTLPKPTLRLLAEQAERSGAVLVLRGLKANSMRRTVAAVEEIAGERRVGWLIDPESFTRYGISHAPTFVLSTSGSGDPSPCTSAACTPETSFVAISGDVSLDYALETMARRRPEVADTVASLLKRLRGS